MITIDLLGMDRDALLSAIRELDREAGARLNCYPKMIVDGKLSMDVAKQRQIALATAREACACVARGMIAEDGVGRGVRVVPVVPVDGGSEDGEAEDGGDLTAKGAKGREGGAA
jgi:hypothetical protein